MFEAEAIISLKIDYPYCSIHGLSINYLRVEVANWDLDDDEDVCGLWRVYIFHYLFD